MADQDKPTEENPYRAGFERIEQVIVTTGNEVAGHHIVGTVRAHPKQEGVYELGLLGLTVVQLVGAEGEHGEYPIGKKEHGVQFLRPLILRDIGILAAFAVLMAGAAVGSIRREVA